VPLPTVSLLATATALLVFAAACGGGSGRSGQEAPATDAPVTSPSEAPGDVEVENAGDADQEPTEEDIAARIDQLAVEIGPRAAGSAEEQAAADYIEQQLSSFGYEVEQQEFEIASFVSDRSTVTAEGNEYEAFAVQGSAPGEAEGELVFAELGHREDVPREAAGQTVLVQRGDITFAEKVQNAQNAGARAVIIFNNEPGPLFATIGGQAEIPVVTVSGLDGGALRDAAAAGETARVEVTGDFVEDSQNVIARSDTSPCSIYVTAHYDTVQIAPGGQDNASGTAAVLEVAEALSDSGLASGVCFIAFGAEEIGLLGSIHFVDSLGSDERQTIATVFNLDATGVGDALFAAGAEEIQGLLLGVAQGAGIAYENGELPENASSDHAAFLEQGIPAVIISSVELGPIHTPEDTAELVNVELVLEAVRLTILAIEELARAEG
jgi:aminopeptidase YwaD